MFPSWNPHNTSRIFPWSSSKWRVAMMLASKVLVFALSGDTSNSIWVYWVYHTDLGKLSPTWNKAHNGPPSFQRGYSEVVISYPDLGILDYWVYHSVSYRYVWKHLERSSASHPEDVLSQDLHSDVFGRQGMAVSLAPCPEGLRGGNMYGW